MGETFPIMRPGTARRFMLLGLLSLLALCVQLLLAGRAEAAALTGGASPTIVGGLADLNGDGVANGRDDANEFYGDTHIIDGKLDCDAWGPIPTTAAPATKRSTARTTARSSGTTVRWTGSRSTSSPALRGGQRTLPTVFNALDPANPTSAFPTSPGLRSTAASTRTGTRRLAATTATSGSSAGRSTRGSSIRRTEPTSLGTWAETTVGSRRHRTRPTTASST